MTPDPDEWEQCLKVLQYIADQPEAIDSQPQFKTLIAKIYKQGRKQVKQRKRNAQQQADRAMKDQVIQARADQTPSVLLPASTTRLVQTLQKPISCYICKQPYVELHYFYHRLCPTCAALNFRKRQQQADLQGRNVILTGGRIKIGFEVALRCLRDGANVYVTTRFPQDAFNRFQQTPDFAAWGSRLRLYGLDLRNVSALDTFIETMLQDLPHLDILINNAAQTIKRPLAYYQQLLEQPAAPAHPQLLQASIDLLELNAPQKSLRELAAYFPRDQWDDDGQPLDKRANNSWSASLADVDIRELVEVQLVNAIAPFILCSQLKPLFLQSPHAQRFIINVSAMEGQFNRQSKTHRHPHTNMAKAALNMLTRTSAADYVRDQIFMNSVDTGWITDENPYPLRERLKEQGFVPPLDIVDGRARILDPIYTTLNKTSEPLHGHFLKDYAPYPW